MTDVKCAHCNSSNLKDVIFLGEGENIIGAILALVNPLAAPQVVYRVARNHPMTAPFRQMITGKWDMFSEGHRAKCLDCQEKLIYCESCQKTFSTDTYPPLSGKVRCKNCRTELLFDRGKESGL